MRRDKLVQRFPPLCNTIVFARNPQLVHPDMGKKCNRPGGDNEGIITK